MIKENIVIQFLKEQQPQIITKAPARINLINPLDASRSRFMGSGYGNQQQRKILLLVIVMLKLTPKSNLH